MRIRGTALAMLALGVVTVFAAAPSQAASKSVPTGSPAADTPLDNLPDHIRQLPLPEGVGAATKPQFAPDGRSLFVIDENGEVWDYQLDHGTGAQPRATKLTGRFAPKVLRATPLTNGDLVLCAPADATGGRIDGKIWLMQRPLGKRPPVPLNESCWEGIAVSHAPGSTTIAWVRSHYDFYDPDRDIQTAQSQIFTGRISYDRRGTPSLVDTTKLVDREDFPGPVLLESQDFRSVRGRHGTDRQLVFTMYGYQGSEVMSIDRETGQIVNHSRSPWYDEAEGIDPAGRWTLVERDISSTRGPVSIDLWRVPLDGQAKWERLTYFMEFDGYGANQPAVSPNSRWIAFTLKDPNDDHGEGSALLLFDLEKWNRSGQGHASIEADRLPPYSPQPTT